MNFIKTNKDFEPCCLVFYLKNAELSEYDKNSY